MEKHIVKKIKDWLSQFKGDFYKVHGTVSQRSGEPDLTGSILYKNIWLHFNIEVKRPGRQPTKLQIYRLQKWHQCDRVVGVARCVEDMEKIFDAYWAVKMGLTKSLDLHDPYGLYAPRTAFVYEH